MRLALQFDWPLLTAILLLAALMPIRSVSAAGNENSSLPLPQLKAAATPAPTGPPKSSSQVQLGAQPQGTNKPQATAQAQTAAQPQAVAQAQNTAQRQASLQPQPPAPLGPNGLPVDPLPQLKTSRRVLVAEPLPSVDPLPAPIVLEPLLVGSNFVTRTVAGMTAYNRLPGGPDQIPMPLVRPQQVTVPGGLRPLSDITTDIAPPSGPLPKDRSDVLVVGTTNPMFFARSANLVQYQWEAPVVPHGPLYFQDVPLEHFGQSCCPCLQPAISAAKFLGNVLILPYRMALDPPCQEQYNLRNYPRPGTPVPCLRETIPLRLRPLLVQIGVVTAIVLVIP